MKTTMTLKVAATHPDQHADWTVQTGHVQW